MYEKFIARQPIFDERLKLFAYELLFRSSDKNVFQSRPEASSSIIVDSVTLFDLQALLGHAKAFINLDEAALQRGAARLLPPERVVIELLETVVPSPEVVQHCRDLCASGYLLALDDLSITRNGSPCSSSLNSSRWTSASPTPTSAAPSPSASAPAASS